MASFILLYLGKAIAVKRIIEFFWGQALHCEIVAERKISQCKA